LKKEAKLLRKNSTQPEKRLWRCLRNRELAGRKIRRQHPVGPFIVDFMCIEKKIVNEVDGGHHAENIEEDSKRSEYLKEQGYRVLRFWNDEVFPHPLPRKAGARGLGGEKPGRVNC